MIITNNQGLPRALVEAVKRDTHKGADYSASALTKSPRALWLERRHGDEITKDASEMVWALFGTAVHAVLERADNEHRLTEEYLTAEIAGKTLSGTCDLYDDGIISDWKTTSVWSYIYLDRARMDEYESQLNAYAYLFRKYGFAVDGLQIVMLFRDWQASKAKYDPSYPQSQVKVVPVELWDEMRQVNYLIKRITMYEGWSETPDDELPLCSADYRWAKTGKWAVMKEGRKSAIKLYDAEAEALNASASDSKLYVQERPGEQWKRCEYCNGRDFCNQYKEGLE
jgi:hypothetical protein